MHKTFFAVFALIAGMNVKAQSQPIADQEALKAVEVFFEGFHAGDTLMMRSVLAENAVLKSVSARSDGAALLSETSLSSLLKAIAERPESDIWEEVLTDTVVYADGPLAMVWAPYTFRRNGQNSHCGANLFTLARTEGNWKILSITDSRRRTGCGFD